MVIWKMIAFLGKYGNQPARHLLEFPMDDLKRLADAVGHFLEEESKQVEDR